MNSISRGIRNAFRNTTRTISIVVILGLSMGLTLAMLIAHQAVNNKIVSVKAAVGNNISIAPAGFNGFSQVNNALTTTELSPISTLPHISSISESLSGRLTTIGTSQPSFGSNQSSSNSNNSTSLTSPVTLNGNGGGRLFNADGGSIPTNFSLPISILGTNDPSKVNATAIVIKSGSTLSGNQDNNNALVSANMAAKNNLVIGSTFTAYATNMTVTGIFSSNSTNSTRGSDNTIIVSLPAEQRLSGQSDAITSSTAYVDSIDNLNSATAAIKNKLGSTADVTSSVDQANQAVQPLNSVKSISLYSLIGAIIAGGVIILLTMVMIVRERTREIGVLKAIGASNIRVAFQFMSEALTLTVMGALIGIALAVVSAGPITHLLVNNSNSTASTPGAIGGGFGGGFRTGGGGPQFASGGRGTFGVLRNNFTNIHAAAGWSVILYGLLSAFLIAIIGSLVASYLISKVRPAEVMRTE